MGRDGSHFFCAQGCPKAGKQKSQNSKVVAFFLWSHNSVGCKVRSSRPSAGKFLVSSHARDDLEPRPPWRTPSCNSLGNHLQQRKKHHEQTVTQTVFEKCSHAKGVMATVFLDGISDFSRQCSNNIQNSVRAVFLLFSYCSNTVLILFK